MGIPDSAFSGNALAFREGDSANEPDWLFLELSYDGSCDVVNIGKNAENGTAG
jgi:hypothetical protein